MCLTIKVSSARVDPDRVVSIVKAWPPDRMPFHVDRTGWIRQRPVGFALHACDLLTDDADWNAATWAMQPEALPALADSFGWLLDEIDGDVIIEAVWDEDATTETFTTPADFLETVRAGALGTKTRYLINS